MNKQMAYRADREYRQAEAEAKDELKEALALAGREYRRMMVDAWAKRECRMAKARGREALVLALAEVEQ